MVVRKGLFEERQSICKKIKIPKFHGKQNLNLGVGLSAQIDRKAYGEDGISVDKALPTCTVRPQ